MIVYLLGEGNCFFAVFAKDVIVYGCTASDKGFAGHGVSPAESNVLYAMRADNLHHGIIVWVGC